MSIDFVPKLVMDSRLALSDKRDFPVFQSAASITPQIFKANSNSTSNLTYTIQVPSLENLVEMVVLVKSTISLTITGSPAAGDYLLSVDTLNVSNPALPTQSTGNFCLNALPFHQLMTTANVTINQSQFNIDMQNVLPSLLYMIGRDQLSEYNDMCPTALDNVSNYTQAGYAGSNSSVFRAWTNNFGYKNAARGGWKIDSIEDGPGFAPGAGNAIGDGSARGVVVTFTTTEPLLISPFTFGKLGPALQGCQAINVNLNLDTSANRYIKFQAPIVGVAPVSRTVSLKTVNSELQVIFMAPKASQLAKFNPRNILNFYKADRYLSVGQTVNGGGSLFNSPSIQLSSIPKAILITIRPTADNNLAGTSTTPNWFLPITNVNIQFNSRAGLLSSASQYQLYKASAETGVQMSWLEWSGVAQIPSVPQPPTPAAPAGVTASQIKTIGSVLALEFGKHIEIAEEYSAPSSLGQFNLQVAASYGANTYPGNFELCMIVINDGLVSTSRGNTNSYVNLLSKQTVMDVLGDVPVYDSVTDSVTEPVTESVPESVSSDIEGSGRRRRAMGRSGGAPSGGRSKLHSRLM